jgi:hypothetical protein
MGMMPSRALRFPAASGVSDATARTAAATAQTTANAALPTAKADWTGGATGRHDRSLTETYGATVRLSSYLSDAMLADVKARTRLVDCKAAFIAAAAVLSTLTNSVQAPAALLVDVPGDYMVDGTGATVASPIVCCSFTGNNIFVEGLGDSTRIYMSGINATQLNAAVSDSGSGADFFTVFSYISVSGGGVRNLRIDGPYVTGTDAALVNLQPRCKGVGIFNSQNVNCTGLNGKGIAGNLINWRGNTGVEATSTRLCRATDCYGESTAESPFNFMGGTYKCQLIGCATLNSGLHGCETGCIRGVISSCVFLGTKRSGISLVGDHNAVTGCIIDDLGNGLAGQCAGISYQYNSSTFNASDNTITGCHVVCSTAGSSAITGGHDAARNIVIGGTYRCTDANVIYLNPTNGAGGCPGCEFHGVAVTCDNTTTRYAVFVNYFCDHFKFIGGTVAGGLRNFHFAFALAGGSPDYPTSYIDATTDSCSRYYEIKHVKMTGAASVPMVLTGYDWVFDDNTVIPDAAATAATACGQITQSSGCFFRRNRLVDNTGSQRLQVTATNDADPRRKPVIERNTGGGYDLTGTAAYAGGTITTSSASAQSNITVTGAAIGDRVEAWFDVDTAGCLVVARVSATSTVRWHFDNGTGGSATIAAGNVYVRVLKGG